MAWNLSLEKINQTFFCGNSRRKAELQLWLAWALKSESRERLFLIETAFGTFPLSSRNDSFSSALQKTESSMTESHKVEEVLSLIQVDSERMIWGLLISRESDYWFPLDSGRAWEPVPCYATSHLFHQMTVILQSESGLSNFSNGRFKM